MYNRLSLTLCTAPWWTQGHASLAVDLRTHARKKETVNTFECNCTFEICALAVERDANDVVLPGIQRDRPTPTWAYSFGGKSPEIKQRKSRALKSFF